ncbi:glutathione S-transferase Gst3 [Gloeopeniophorella convolvens]|nr:glutathione S-transferase Gst3 [Gloeopeniophorella convolvens]
MSSRPDTQAHGSDIPFRPARYHLYSSSSCPWAAQCLIMLRLKGLEDYIGITTVSPRLGKDGWAFASADSFPGTDSDPLYGSRNVRDLYTRSHPHWKGGFAVPLLWDRKTERIVNNNANDIVRMFNSSFNDILPPDKARIDMYPAELRDDIDYMTHWIKEKITNAILKTGFAKSSMRYCENVIPLFESFDELERVLRDREYVMGSRLTEVDIKLYVDVIRFDTAYCQYFKCNMRTIRRGYPSIHLWLRKLYWRNPAFQSSTDFDHIKNGFFTTFDTCGGATRVVPIGPVPHIEPL